MRYRVTCLSPTLVGDGRRLSAIDYMVWKDQVNVLDQERIFRLLARGPRLEGYLLQLRKAERLDFATWGGFAQSYAERRIPFSHASDAAAWSQAPPDQLAIPTFMRGARGAYLPASALKGALRAGLVGSRVTDKAAEEWAKHLSPDRPLRRPGESLEDATLGPAALRGVGAADSLPVAPDAFRIHLLRVATLVARGQELALGWKRSPHGTVDGSRPDSGTPLFAEMAAPGTTFEGSWGLQGRPGRDPIRLPKLMDAANEHAARLLAAQGLFASRTGLVRVQAALAGLEAALAKARESGGCLLCLGWGTGLLGKVARPDVTSGPLRDVARRVPDYDRALRTGLPFPKTRRILFREGQPAGLPGWVRLDVE